MGRARLRVALDWLDAELSNLRAGFRWAADHGELDTASSIAAHSSVMGHLLQQWEPTRWAEELLDAATAADVPLLPRLYTAAAYGLFAGRAEAAVGYARTAETLEDNQNYLPFRPGWSHLYEVVALLNCGRIDLAVQRN
jgi:hypothetical protein